MQTNYYETLVKDLEKLIEEERYEEADALIDNELSLPYVPLEVEKRLVEMKQHIFSYIEQIPQHIDIEKVFGILSQKVDINKVDAVEILSKFNLGEYLTEVRELLKLEEEVFPYLAKVKVMQMLIGQRIDETFEILAYDGQVFEANLKGMLPIEELEGHEVGISKITDQLSDNPLASSIAIGMFENVLFESQLRGKNEEIDEQISKICELAVQLTEEN